MSRAYSSSLGRSLFDLFFSFQEDEHSEARGHAVFFFPLVEHSRLQVFSLDTIFLVSMFCVELTAELRRGRGATLFSARRTASAKT